MGGFGGAHFWVLKGGVIFGGALKNAHTNLAMETLSPIEIIS